MNDAGETNTDPPWFHDLLAATSAPFTAVITIGEATPHGATVSSDAPLSAKPPSATFALDRRTPLLAHALIAGRFETNLLGHHHATLPTLFARRGADRFAAMRCHVDQGLHRRARAAGCRVCDVHDVVKAGDRELILGHVEAADRRNRRRWSTPSAASGSNTATTTAHDRRSSTRSAPVPAHISS
jgi:flavin reductase (DIM6/NTAB) family NADH-FMN oxidoreductase RutF